MTVSAFLGIASILIPFSSALSIHDQLSWLSEDTIVFMGGARGKPGTSLYTINLGAQPVRHARMAKTGFCRTRDGDVLFNALMETGEHRYGRFDRNSGELRYLPAKDGSPCPRRREKIEQADGETLHILRDVPGISLALVESPDGLRVKVWLNDLTNDTDQLATPKASIEFDWKLEAAGARTVHAHSWRLSYTDEVILAYPYVSVPERKSSWREAGRLPLLKLSWNGDISLFEVPWDERLAGNAYGLAPIRDGVAIAWATDRFADAPKRGGIMTDVSGVLSDVYDGHLDVLSVAPSPDGCRLAFLTAADEPPVHQQLSTIDICISN